MENLTLEDAKQQIKELEILYTNKQLEQAQTNCENIKNRLETLKLAKADAKNSKITTLTLGIVQTLSSVASSVAGIFSLLKGDITTGGVFLGFGGCLASAAFYNYATARKESTKEKEVYDKILYSQDNLEMLKIYEDCCKYECDEAGKA